MYFDRNNLYKFHYKMSIETECLGLVIHKTRDNLLSQQAHLLVQKHYMRSCETSPQQAFARAAVAFCANDLQLAQRIYDYVSTGKCMFSSPILSNAPFPNETPKAFPISCFLAYVPDNLEGLIDHTTEIRWMSVNGGGVGGHWSDVRAISPDKAPGPIPFLHTIDADMTAYKQGKTRKGSYAAYLNISHPDIIEFINMKIPTGDSNRKNLNLFNAINITDLFMRAVQRDEQFDLIDPHDNVCRDTVSARKLWQLILTTRARTGVPYLNFIDTINRAMPTPMKKAGNKIHGSNLCNEIHLPTSSKKTAVCCLSSVNLEYYREWRGDGQLIRDLIRFLDNVLTFFIEHCPPQLARAKIGACEDRPLGLGVMGEHTLFQKEGIPFESDKACQLDDEIFKFIKQEAIKESQLLAQERGECPVMKGTGMRHSHILAIAPTANSSIILNCSPSIEPWRGNAFTHRTRIGSHLFKNAMLQRDLAKLQPSQNTDEIWLSIITNKGSVQHLDIPSELKEIYKTASELDQRNIVKMAANRQRYLCQGQSINLFFPFGADVKYVHETHYKMWEMGGKGLYYYRTESIQSVETISSTCMSCDG